MPAGSSDQPTLPQALLRLPRQHDPGSGPAELRARFVCGAGGVTVRSTSSRNEPHLPPQPLPLLRWTCPKLPPVRPRGPHRGPASRRRRQLARRQKNLPVPPARQRRRLWPPLKVRGGGVRIGAEQKTLFNPVAGLVSPGFKPARHCQVLMPFLFC